jgi:hypothetical protein
MDPTTSGGSVEMRNGARTSPRRQEWRRHLVSSHVKTLKVDIDHEDADFGLLRARRSSG